MSKPKHIDKTLLDGDIVAYRCSASAEKGTPEEAFNKVDDLVGYIINETVVFPTEGSFKVYLSGKSNFRHTIAETHGYKANRRDVPKPIHLGATRDYLVSEYGAVISVGCEADDLIAMEAMKGNPNTTVIASIDKDFLTVPVWMFNFVKNTWEKPSEWDSLKYFYSQILTGDRADNIVGIHGVGPKKAEKLLGDAKTERDLWDVCLKAYDGDYERVLENARLLHLQRYERELWEPPK